MNTTIKSPVELEKWDVHGVLSGNASADFGSIEAKMSILAERVRMIKSSLEVNEAPTQWDFERLDEIIKMAEKAEQQTRDLFTKLNYSVIVKHES